jgi:N-acetyltransferase
MQRVEFKTDVRNERTRAALLSLGAAFEGIARKHMILPSGTRDSAWFAIVNDDWPAVRTRLLERVGNAAA